MTHYTDIELRRAFALTAYKPAGLDFETAMRNPLYAKVIEAKAASDRQLRRELARRAEQARAGRWLELRADPLAGVALTWWSLTGPRLHRAAQLYRTRGLRYTLASAWREAGRL